MRKLQKYPSKTLSTACEEVNDLSTLDEAKIRRDALAFCRMYDGVAVAAPQWGDRLRYFYIKDLDLVAVNPVIVSHSEESVELVEGCLSVGPEYPISRWETVTWKYTTLDGGEYERTSTGWEARVVQHEIDHLDGITIADH